MNATVRLMLGGDVMLGRLVKDAIRSHGSRYPLGEIAPLMRAADLTLVNLECAITESERLWHGAPKAFYFGAPPAATESLLDAGVDLVSLANNHILDFGEEGLLDTLRLLDARGIAHAGAGTDLAGARSPAVIERNGVRFGMVAYCDHQSDFAAAAGRPGIAFLDLEEQTRVLAQLREDLRRLQAAGVDWPILSLHWGPNMLDRPSPEFISLARAAIDAGYALLFGHSAHVFHGVEIHRGRPIIYAAGDLVDDYYVDPEFRNDHQLLFEFELTREKLLNVRFHPVFIDDCRTVPATGAQFEYIVARATRLCLERGTAVRREGDRVWIEA